MVSVDAPQHQLFDAHIRFALHLGRERTEHSSEWMETLGVMGHSFFVTSAQIKPESARLQSRVLREEQSNGLHMPREIVKYDVHRRQAAAYEQDRRIMGHEDGLKSKRVHT